ATFGETTAPLLGTLPVATALAYAAEAVRLYRQHGWHGEFLAQSYLTAAPRALRVLSPEQFPLWAGLGAALRRVMRESEFYGALPVKLAEWADADRTAFLRTALALAVYAPPTAATFYSEGAEAIRALPATLRTTLLQVCALAGKRAAASFADLIPVLGAV